MWTDQRLLDLLKIQHPILQAPMAGVTNPELAAAVSESGALGGFGAAACNPDQLSTVVEQIRDRTKRPFNINLFSPATEDFDRNARPSAKFGALLEQYHRELELAEVPDPIPLFGPYKDQVEVLIGLEVPVVSLHFGTDPELVARIQKAGIKVLCSATSLDEAKVLEAAGVDAIIAQGSEAGGHRGTFLGDHEQALLGTMTLVPRLVDAVTVPVIAAGGAMDARGIVACLALGAAGVQMGTAFLGCQEAPLPEIYREVLDRAEGESTVVTKSISGKPARAIRNRYIEDVEALAEEPLPYPAQYAVSRELRKHSAKANDPSFSAFWAGQGVGLLQRTTAAELVSELVSGAKAVSKRVAVE